MYEKNQIETKKKRKDESRSKLGLADNQRQLNTFVETLSNLQFDIDDNAFLTTMSAVGLKK